MMSKRRAKQDMRPRWLIESSGALTVSTHGFYMEDNEHGIRRWKWNDLPQLEWKAQSAIEFLVGQTNNRVRLESDWAELIFVSWIQLMFRDHPQRHAWFTRDWLDRVRAAGYDPLGNAVES